MIAEEEWRDFPGYENVMEISNFGRVRKKARLDYKNRVIPAKLLKIHNGYLRTSINNKRLVFNMKRIIASVFLQVPEELQGQNLIVVRIRNGKGCSADNLKYITMEEYYKTEAYRRSIRLNNVAKTIKRTPDVIVQLRENGEYVRRYRDIQEVLEVHPLWNEVELMMSLTDFMPDAYGYKWRYECKM